MPIVRHFGKSFAQYLASQTQNGCWSRPACLSQQMLDQKGPYARMLFYLYMLVLFLAPLPLGSNRPWSWFALAALLLLMAGLEALMMALGRIRHSPAQFRQLLMIGIPFMLVMAWAAVQAFMPFETPIRHPLWEQVDLSGLGDGANTISANAERTKIAIILMMGYGASFFLAWRYAVDPERAKTLTNCLWIAGIFHVLLGFFHLAGLIRPPAELAEFPHNRLAFPFVNANNMATYCGIALMAAMLTYAGLLRRLKITGFGLRVALYRFLEEITGKSGLFLLVILFLFGGILLTASRAGLLAVALGILTLLAFVLFSSQANPTLKKGIALGVPGALCLLTVLSGRWISERLELIFSTGFDEASGFRTHFWSNTIDAILDRPLTGHGYGSFQDAYPAYAQEIQTRFLDKAHQSYLELTMELGIPAAIIFFLIFLMMAIIFVRGFIIRQRNRLFPAAGFATLMLVGMHALFDFSAQIPAVAVTFAALLGMAYVQSERTERRRHQA